MSNYFATFFSVAFIRMLGMGFSLILSVLVARGLDTSEAGSYFLLLSIANFFGILFCLGSHQAIVKFFSNIGGDLNLKGVMKLLEKRIRLVVIGMSIIGGYILLNYDSSISLIGYWESTLIVLVPLLLTQNFVVEIHKSQSSFKKSALSQNVLPLFLLNIFIFSFLTFEIQLNAFVVSIIYSVAIFISVIINRPNFGEVIPEVDNREFNNFSNAIFVNQLSGLGILYIHIWVIGWFLPNEQVAIYEIAVKLATLSSVSLLIVTSIVSPKLASMDSGTARNQIVNLIRKTYLILVAPCVVISLFFTLYGKELIVLMYGSDYSRSYDVLLILLVGQFINVACGFAGAILSMRGYHQELKKASLLTFIFSLIFAPTLCFSYGVIGVSISSAVAMILLNVLFVYAVYKHLRIYCFLPIRKLKENI